MAVGLERDLAVHQYGLDPDDGRGPAEASAGQVVDDLVGVRLAERVEVVDEDVGGVAGCQDASLLEPHHAGGQRAQLLI